MRVALLGIHHETNTFAPVRATLEQWQRAGILTGEEIRERYGASRSSAGGYFAYAADDHDVQLVPLVYAQATPMGAITGEAFEHLMERVISALDAGGPWDGVLMPLHGAAVADDHPDADGELIRRVRTVVGQSVPIGVTLDMHANVSQQMVDHADVITVYQTNPHVDAYEQGHMCARLIAAAIRGKVRPRMAVSRPPLAINILKQGTDDEPIAGLLRIAEAQRTLPDVLSVSVVEGFPYADVAEQGMSFIAVTDDDRESAAQVAQRLAEAAWEMRPSFVGDAVDIDDALRTAGQAPTTPVVLLDTGDNVGGGSPGDSTHLLHAARRLGIAGILQELTDPAVAQACIDAGVGARISVDVGGKTDSRHGAPFAATGTVTAAAEGTFEDATPTHGGFRFHDIGPTAGLRTDDGFDLVISSRAIGTRSQEQFRLVGFEPKDAPIIVAKGVHSPRAAFESLASRLIWVATPGATSADLNTFRYTNRRRPMFPFESDAAFPRRS